MPAKIKKVSSLRINKTMRKYCIFLLFSIITVFLSVAQSAFGGSATLLLTGNGSVSSTSVSSDKLWSDIDMGQSTWNFRIKTPVLGQNASGQQLVLLGNVLNYNNNGILMLELDLQNSGWDLTTKFSHQNVSLPYTLKFGGQSSQGNAIINISKQGSQITFDLNFNWDISANGLDIGNHGDITSSIMQFSVQSGTLNGH